MIATRIESTSRLATGLAALVCVLLIGHFCWRFATTAANIAFADDIVDALWFFEIFRQTEGWWDKLATLFLPNHEHILLFDHVVYLIYYAIAGELNFLHFVLIGNVSLPWLAYLLWRWGREHIDGRVALVLSVACAFQLFSSESNFFSVASLSTKFVFIFAMIAFLCWQRNPAAIWQPLIWALLSISVQFNGLLVLLVLLLLSVFYALMDGVWRGKQLLCWGVFALLTISTYISYESPLTLDHLARHVQATDMDKAHEFARNVAVWQEQMAERHSQLTISDYVCRFVSSLLVLVGASIWPNDFSRVLMLSQVSGAVMLAGFVVLAQRGWWRNTFWLALTLWVLASLLMLAIGRGLSLGEASGLVSRYRYYSFILLFLLLVPIWQICAQRLVASALKQVFCAIVLAVGIALMGTSEWRVVADLIVKVQTSYRYLLVDGGLSRSQMPFYPHNLDKRLLNAHAGGYFSIYHALPQSFKPEQMLVFTRECPPLPMLEQVVTVYSKSSRALAVEMTFELVPSATGDEVLVCNDVSGAVLVLGRAQQQMDGARYLPQVVLKSELAPAHYQVYARARGSQTWRAIGAIEFR